MEMGTVTRLQILDETVSISHNSNNLAKDTNPIILFPIIGK